MTEDEIRRQELSELLRTRRARISPEEAGLPATNRRRTPGLRREEVAQLAGISATWYSWLEQRREIRVSPGILDNLARVLRLDPAERIHLFQLALRQPVIDSTPKPEAVSPLIQRMLDRIDPIPAFVMGRRWDVLAWNRAARAFFFDFEQVPASERNILWLTFTSAALRRLMVNWPERARDVLARFRADHGRHAGDAYFVQLVERLKSISPDFAQWWPRYDIRPMSEGRREYQHPMAGRMIVEHTTLLVHDNPDLRLLVMMAADEAGSIEKMRKVVAAGAGSNRSISEGASHTSRKRMSGQRRGPRTRQ
jgi:transcriptional regulator with XRE-family HTH domain